ncbi:MAG: hypothetical protein J6W41_03655, partial [Alphaproteobacteria bacterium]|nr:hypothetical protein [Alphaproteobacteria bacterium]
ATLQSGKQTRPADNAECPAYKQCLLVEDENGTPHWYQITDPFRDFVAPIIANNVAPASTTNQPGFTQLEYVDMQTGSYLQTDLVPTYNSKIAFDLQVIELPTAGGAFLGGRTGAMPTGLNFAWNPGSWAFVMDAFSENRFNSAVSMSANTRYQYVFDNKVATIYKNDTPIERYTFDGENANGGALAINALNNQGNIVALGVAHIYVYFFKMWNAQGTLVANYVPARRNSDNVVGFYDTVSRSFKTATTGTFTAGPTVANTDVPTNPTWTATWAADATTGVSAGTVYGEGLCNGVAGTASIAATSTQTSSANWSVDGANCWCRVTGVDDGNESSDVDGVWVLGNVYGSAAVCASNCAVDCADGVRYPAFRSAVFGM